MGNNSIMQMITVIEFFTKLLCLVGFKTLMRAFQVKESHPDCLAPKRFKSYVRDWGKLFLEMYHDDDITPYIHSM